MSVWQEDELQLAGHERVDGVVHQEVEGLYEEWMRKLTWDTRRLRKNHAR